MGEFVDYGDAVFFIRNGEDNTWIHKKQDEYDQLDKTGRLYYVPVDGCDDKYLHPHRFIVENYNQSLVNHMAWEGIFDSDEQMTFMINALREFQKTGKQLLLEEKTFSASSQVYDYSMQR
jgi:hypothetical protein